jgi:hypothetical protein
MIHSVKREEKIFFTLPVIEGMGDESLSPLETELQYLLALSSAVSAAAALDFLLRKLRSE